MNIFLKSVVIRNMAIFVMFSVGPGPVTDLDFYDILGIQTQYRPEHLIYVSDTFIHVKTE